MDPADLDPIKAALQIQGAFIGRHEHDMMQQRTLLVRAQTEGAQPAGASATASAGAGAPTPVLASPLPPTIPSAVQGDALVANPERALAWATSLWELDSPDTVSSASFMKAIQTTFHNPRRGWEAAPRLLALSQGARSVADYAIEFRKLEAERGWNEETLMAVETSEAVPTLLPPIPSGAPPQPAHHLVGICLSPCNWGVQACRIMALGLMPSRPDALATLVAWQETPGPAPHNPQIDWSTQSVYEWGPQCDGHCLADPCPVRGTPSSTGPARPDLTGVPKEYWDLKQVFSKEEAQHSLTSTDLFISIAQLSSMVTPVFVFTASNLKELVSQTMVSWAQESHIQDPQLVRMMFSLLRRQYDSIGELLRAMRKSYSISAASVHDTINLLASLGQIRSLLSVRMGKEEEQLMIDGLSDIMNNKVFYQHPNLMRILGMHETVMEVMVNVLGGGKSQEIAFPKMVASCCRFLCYFCRISRQNQKAMFDHLSYLLENSSVGLASPSMRGSTPLDVAASSVMDNYGLALALEEPDLEKVVTYLAGCGLQSCPMLLAKGYPDIGWNPIEGERYLSFLRFAVFVNGESVEENSSVVVKLLIRRPECFGPALRGEGGNGLLAAMKEAIKISETPALDLPSTAQGLLSNVSTEDDEEEEVVHMGNAIMSFYSALIDLLGRCAPEMHLINKGKGEALRIRAILRSLVPTEDLVGIISIPLKMPVVNKDGSVTEPDMSACFCPDHKSPMVLFLDRVYGIEDQSFLLHLLEVGFLPDLRAAASMDTNSCVSACFGHLLRKPPAPMVSVNVLRAKNNSGSCRCHDFQMRSSTLMPAEEQ
ncbi:hypothetical protein AOLI_G00125510 [Acnodon oligacanthus]